MRKRLKHELITTEPGDVILYQGNQVTIYYDVNSWSFTRIGRVHGLSQAENSVYHALKCGMRLIDTARTKKVRRNG